MSGPVGWHLNEKVLLIRPVANICLAGELMSVRFFARNSDGRIGMGEPERIAENEFFGAPVFVFCRIAGANRWLLDEENLHIRPVAEVFEARRPKAKVHVRFVAGKGEENELVPLAAHEVLHDIHSDAFQRLTRLLQGEK